MPGGAYAALSGMRARLEDLDRLASDLANVGTSGYKTERAATVSAERPSFRAVLDSAVDVTTGGTKLDFRPGTIGTTGRDLDAAIEGNGFFAVTTPNGERYTRNGSFVRRADGVLTTADGLPVAAAGAPGQPPAQIRVGTGTLSISQDGTVKAGDVIAGRLKVVSFASEADIERESGTRFRAKDGVTPAAATPRIVGGALEQSNVTMVDRMVALTEVQRSFEALQRGVSMLMNDLDARAIGELGRR
jgi:flagellar basal-body rod protein FlgF